MKGRMTDVANPQQCEIDFSQYHVKECCALLGVDLDDQHGRNNIKIVSACMKLQKEETNHIK